MHMIDRTRSLYIIYTVCIGLAVARGTNTLHPYSGIQENSKTILCTNDIEYFLSEAQENTVYLALSTVVYTRWGAYLALLDIDKNK